MPGNPSEAPGGNPSDESAADVAIENLPGLSSRRFLLRRRLGEGGFGVVYEALDRERNATVALKVLRRLDGQSIARFKGEFRSLAETVHPNLVQLYELHGEGDAWLFTMELVRGEDALAYVRPFGGPCDERRLRAVFLQLAEGLSCLHASGKLHRDVKPSNVMVTPGGRVVIVDFGLVSDIHDLQGMRGVFGTPMYMAPEQAAGLPVGTAADWYAVGVMLYEALAGCLPGQGRADAPIAMGTTRTMRPLARDETATSSGAARSPAPQEWIPPSLLTAGVPEDLDRLCLELLAHAPNQRPPGPEVCRRLAVERPATEFQAEPREERSGVREAPFVGRAPQLAALRDALAAAEQGGAVTVFLHGRSGMGKSALLQRFLSEVRETDPARLVLFGRCFEQESVPYKGVDGLVDDLCRHLWERSRAIASTLPTLPADFPMLVRLFPQLGGLAEQGPPSAAGGIDDPSLRPRAFAVLRELLVQPRVPVLVVDDLQWGDLDSIALLTALLQGPRPTPLLLLTTYRAEDEPSSPVLRTFFEALSAIEDRVDVRRVEVGALDDREAEALSRKMLETTVGAGTAVAEKSVAALMAEAHGDPFLLTELARRAPGEAPGSGTRTGTGAVELGTLLAARIGRLPEPARQLLEVIALEGQPITRALAARAAFGGERESEAVGAINVLRAGRLIRSRQTEGGDEILPYHDRIRELVAGGLDADRGRAHHHRLAQVLEDSGTAEPERLLFHYRSAGRLVDAARHAADAARRAHKALAFERAARLYREALALGAPTAVAADSISQAPVEQRALRVALADALSGAGRPREAADAYLEAARGADSDETLDWSRRAAELLLGAGYTDEGLATLRHVLRAVDVPLHTSVARSLVGLGVLRVRVGLRGLAFRERAESSIARGELLRLDACYAAALGLFIVNPILAAESMARYLILALEVGEPYRAARALGLEAIFQSHRGGPGTSTDRLIEAARRIETRVASSHLTGSLRLAEAMVAQVSGQWRRTHDLAAESETVLARCTSISMELDIAHWLRAHTLWMLGEVAALSRLVPALVQEARERGNRFLEMLVLLSVAPLVDLVQTGPVRAREAVAAAFLRSPPPRGSLGHMRAVVANARISLHEGRGDAAQTEVEDGLLALRQTGLIHSRSQVAELRLIGAIAALSTGDDARAATDARALSNNPVPWAQSAAVVVKAGLARRAGDFDGAVALMARARETARERGAALIDASASRRLGEWIGGSEGAGLIAAADAWMTGQGIVDPVRTTAMNFGWV